MAITHRTGIAAGLLCLLVLIPVTGFSVCQVGEGLFDYGQHRDDSAAEYLAIELTGMLRAPDQEYDRIHRDLRLIRDAHPILETVGAGPRYVMGNLLVQLIDPGPWPEYDAMNTFYQVTGDRLISPSLEIHLLTYCDRINAPVLALMYESLSGVVIAEPNFIVGGGNRITLTVIGQIYRYELVQGFGDCPAGCSCNRVWVLDVEDSGVVALVSYAEPDGGCIGPSACCLPYGMCWIASIDRCYAAGGRPLEPGASCDGDPDRDGLDEVCGDACPEDQNKLEPGFCGCGLPDLDSDGDHLPDFCQCGDSDGDGDVDILDVVLIRRHTVGLPDPPSFDGSRCSVSGDATDCDAADALALRSHLAGFAGEILKVCEAYISASSP